jgi:hypothetical protein
MFNSRKLTAAQYAVVKCAWIQAGMPSYWSKRDFLAHLAMYLREAGSGNDPDLIHRLNSWFYSDVRSLAYAFEHMAVERRFVEECTYDLDSMAQGA